MSRERKHVSLHDDARWGLLSVSVEAERNKLWLILCWNRTLNLEEILEKHVPLDGEFFKLFLLRFLLRFLCCSGFKHMECESPSNRHMLLKHDENQRKTAPTESWLPYRSYSYQVQLYDNNLSQLCTIWWIGAPNKQQATLHPYCTYHSYKPAGWKKENIFGDFLRKKLKWRKLSTVLEWKLDEKIGRASRVFFFTRHHRYHPVQRTQ